MSTISTPPPESADRGMPTLTARRKGGTASMAIKAILIAGVLMLIIAVGFVALANKWKEHQREKEAQAAAEQQQGGHEHMPTLPPDAFSRVNAQADLPLPASTSSSAGPVAAAPAAPAQPSADQVAQQQAAAQRAAAEAQRLQQIADADLIIYGGGNSNASSAQPSSSSGMGGDIAGQLTAAVRAAQQPSQPSGPKDGSLAASLTPTRTDATAAALIANPSMTATKGTTIKCVLESALDSTVPGQVNCRTTQPLYSSDGRVVLAERYSLITGQYESSSLKAGMSRIFILWTRLETPYHVVIDLDSPAADGLGRGGMDGHINNHFWQRFGAGLLLSVVDDVTASAANQTGTQTIQFTNTAQSGNQAAEIALQHSVDIPPTLTKNQGGIAVVYLARDLNFGNVYDLTAAK